MKSVDAVKTESQRIQIASLLAEHNPVYQDIWTFLLNTALRIGDALSISMEDLQTLDAARPCLVITEQKTQKQRKILLNKGAIAVIRKRQEQFPSDMWLFQSTSPNVRRNDPRPINRRTVAHVLSVIGKQTIPSVHLGCHSARKTRGYCLHSAGHSIEKICKILNHSSVAITMRYIGLDQDDIDDSFTELVL